jgi:transcriptional regulator with XRE-family HTH domain
MSQAELAECAGLHQPHLVKIELGTIRARPATIAKLREVIESRGVEFTNGGNPGVRFKTKDSAPDPDPEAAEH